MEKMLKAKVADLQFHATPRGERIYALFATEEGQTMGVWVPANDLLVSQLHLGDWVQFQRNRNGYFCLHNKIY